MDSINHKINFVLLFMISILEKILRNANHEFKFAQHTAL